MPSTSIVETSGSTFWPIVAGLPSTRTRPAATSASDARREATPASARTFWMRSSGIVVEREQQRAALLGEARRDIRVERRELVEALEAEPFEELEGGAVQDRAAGRVRSRELHDEPAVQQAPH